MDKGLAMKTKIIFILLTILSPFLNQVRAAELEFHGNEYGIIYSPQDWYDVNIYDYATVDMIGGSVNILYAFNSSIFNISDGSITSVICSFDLSTVNITGGSIEALATGGSSTANVYGGEWKWTDYIAAFDQSIVNIYGYDFSYSYGRLSGFWLSGIQFDLWLRGPDTYPRVVLHEIPEPYSILLLSMGVLIARIRTKAKT